MNIFNRVFYGHNVAPSHHVDLVNHGGERGGFSGTGWPGYQNQTTRKHGEFFGYGRKTKFVNRTNFERNYAKDSANLVALPKHINSESCYPFNVIAKVHFLK